MQLLYIANNAVNIFKTLPITSFFAGLIAYFMPIAEVFLVMLLFVAVDFVAGSIASRKRGIPFNSRRMRLSLVKLCSYVAVTLLAYAAESAFGLEWLGSYRFIGGFICLVEFLSILENLAVVTENPIFLRIVSIIRHKAKKSYSEITNEISEEKDFREPLKKDNSTDSMN